MSKFFAFPTYMSDSTKKKGVLSVFSEMAIKATSFLKDKDGNLLRTVHLKGDNSGYYWSPTTKKMILVPRRTEYYLLPYEKDEKGRYFLFLPRFFINGVVICVDPDEIEFLGFN